MGVTSGSKIVRKLPGRWSEAQAAAWQKQHGWLVGCNFTPSTAINQLEMWQPQTFDLRTIKRELKWAAAIGFNSVRVFLHNQVWADERGDYLDRIGQFLDAAEAVGIGVAPVLFDSVWHPFPHSGPQREPEPGVHNSGWVQGPGVAVLRDASAFDRLSGYVTEVIAAFRQDPRIQFWDLWNEPCNSNAAAYGPRDLGAEKEAIVFPLLEKTFRWARSVSPMQPLTSGVWAGDWSSDKTLRPIERLQIEASDIITFHNYETPDRLEQRIKQLQRYGRPMVCTEFMARGPGSTFQGCLPVLKRHGVGAQCWGLVRGRTQTHLPWDSWQKPYEQEPDPWFHEVFHTDGQPYRPEEVEVIRSLCQSDARSARRG